MLAGDLAAQLHGLGVELGHEVVHLLYKHILFQIVGAGVDVQVAVPGVAEVLQLEVVVFGQGVGVDDVLRDLGHGDDHVALIQQLALLLDALQEGGPGGPGFLALGGAVGHQHV